MNIQTMPGIELRAEYVQSALYYADADTVEYVRKDGPCVHRRIDDMLTLTLDLNTRELIGFRVKRI